MFKAVKQQDHARAAADVSRRKRTITLRTLRNGRVGGKQDISPLTTSDGHHSSAQDEVGPSSSGLPNDPDDVQMLDVQLASSETPDGASAASWSQTSNNEKATANSEKPKKKRKRQRAAVSTTHFDLSQFRTNGL